MQVKDDMHAVRTNSVVGDLSQVFKLITSVQVGPRDIDPRRVGGGDSNGIDIDSGKPIDGIGRDEGPVVFFEYLATSLLAYGLTERPLVGGVCTAVNEDVRADGQFYLQPAT